MLNFIQNGWRQAITKLLIFGGLASIAIWGLPALAQAFLIRSNWLCESTIKVVEAVKEFDESVYALGKLKINEDQNLVMTLWVSKQGTWSLIVTDQKNPTVSCVVVTGDSFTRYNESVPTKGSI